MSNSGAPLCTAAAASAGAGEGAAPSAPVPPALDRGLLLRARTGDAAARETLAARGGDLAFRFALQLLGDRDAARDVAQDALLRFFATLGRVDPERPIAPWLLRIVRNRVIDLRRRGGVRPEADGEFDPAELPDASPGPQERSERRELQLLMWRCLGRLEPPHREILVLRDYQDLSYREIADALELPLGTVMSRLHAARRRLRQAVLATGYRFGGSP